MGRGKSGGRDREGEKEDENEEGERWWTENNFRKNKKSMNFHYFFGKRINFISSKVEFKKKKKKSVFYFRKHINVLITNGYEVAGGWVVIDGKSG